MTSETAAQLAAQFARYVVPTLMSVAVRVVRIAAVEPRDTVLDLGTTTGLAAFLAAAQAGRDAPVVGVDASAAMLAIAERRSRLAGAQHVRWRVGDATALEFAHESFDAALCIHLLHDLARPDEALAEVQRVLAPGGRLALAVWGRAAQNPWAALVARAAGTTGQRLSPAAAERVLARQPRRSRNPAPTRRVCGHRERAGARQAALAQRCGPLAVVYGVAAHGRGATGSAGDGSSARATSSSLGSPSRIERETGWSSRARWSTRGQWCRPTDGSRVSAGCLYSGRDGRR